MPISVFPRHVWSPPPDDSGDRNFVTSPADARAAADAVNRRREHKAVWVCVPSVHRSLRLEYPSGLSRPQRKKFHETGELPGVTKWEPCFLKTRLVLTDPDTGAVAFGPFGPDDFLDEDQKMDRGEATRLGLRTDGDSFWSVGPCWLEPASWVGIRENPEAAERRLYAFDRTNLYRLRGALVERSEPPHRNWRSTAKTQFAVAPGWKSRVRITVAPFRISRKDHLLGQVRQMRDRMMARRATSWQDRACNRIKRSTPEQRAPFTGSVDGLGLVEALGIQWRGHEIDMEIVLMTAEAAICEMLPPVPTVRDWWQA